MAFSVRPGGPAHLRSAPLASGAAARGTCPRPAARLYRLPGATARVPSSLIKPVPAAPGGTCPPGSRPASTCNRALRPAWRLRSTSRCPQHLGGRAPRIAARPYPPPSTTARVAPFTLLSWCSHRLGERLPPARGLHLLATGRYGPCGIFTHQAGRSAPPTAARPRSASLVVVTRRSRLATSRDHPRERPLTVSLSSRWTSRREEEEGGT